MSSWNKPFVMHSHRICNQNPDLFIDSLHRNVPSDRRWPIRSWREEKAWSSALSTYFDSNTCTIRPIVQVQNKKRKKKCPAFHYMESDSMLSVMFHTLHFGCVRTPSSDWIIEERTQDDADVDFALVLMLWLKILLNGRLSCDSWYFFLDRVGHCPWCLGKVNTEIWVLTMLYVVEGRRIAVQTQKVGKQVSRQRLVISLITRDEKLSRLQTKHQILSAFVSTNADDSRSCWWSSSSPAGPSTG